MPVRVIGMIGVTPPSGGATVHVIRGGLSPAYLRSFAQAHDQAGFDLALVGYTASSAEGFLVAQYAAQYTERLGFLVAHRPGFVAPTLAARKIATFDQLTGGRVAIHIISGASDAEQENEGDFAPKDVRYRRAAEYIEVMKLVWTSQQRFDFDGEFYHLRGTRSDVQPLQKPHPPLFFGGSSEGALAMGAQHCDVFAMFGEPLAATAQRIAEFRAQAARFGRTPTFNISFRPILGATEGRRGIARGVFSPPSRSRATRRASATTRCRSISRRAACSTSPRKARRTTRGCGCPSPRRPARSATPRAWSARPSRSPMPCSNTTSLAYTRSSCAASIPTRIRSSSAAS